MLAMEKKIQDATLYVKGERGKVQLEDVL